MVIGTPRKASVGIQSIAGGQYYHKGLETGLRSLFGNMNESESIAININVNGLPLYKNGTDQFWPILCNIHNLPHINPIIIGIFHGRQKPTKIEEFLSPFVDEITPILKSGISIKEHKLNVKIRAIICDSPARAFIKGMRIFCFTFPIFPEENYVKMLIIVYCRHRLF